MSRRIWFSFGTNPPWSGRMKRCSVFASAAGLAAVLFLAVPSAPAQENSMAKAATALGGHFVKPEAFDLAKLMPAPPEAGSLAAQADLEAVLQAQTWRTPEQVAWAKFIEKDSVFNNSLVLGAWFAKENLPLTAAFLNDILDDVNAVSEGTKKLYARPRPPQVDLRVQPCVTVPKSASYPSGHSTRAFVWAGVLAEVFPEKRAELFEHAHRVAWSRILGGVHFPTDEVGGRLLAEAIVAALKQSADFRAALEKVRAEVTPFLVKKAA
jgi:acid phosphatase (class A)